MARSTASLPDWSGRWSCSQTSGVTAMASIVSGRRSFGCGLVKRMRPIPSTEPTARSSAAKSGRRFVMSRPYELTFCPSKVTSVTPRRASSSTSSTISSRGRLTSGPRTDGTMQKAQELSHPVWMLTQAAYGSSRTAAGPSSGLAPDSGAGASRISMTGPSERARRRRPGALVRLWVPKTTSTHPTFSWMRSRSFWARHPPTAIWRPGLASTSSLSRPSVP